MGKQTKIPIGSTKTLTEKDNGISIELNPGNRFELKLEGNPSTGYTWEVISIDLNIIKQIDEPTFKSSSTALGAGGEMTFHFQTVHVGQTSLNLAYHRPWEKNIPDEKTYQVAIIIR